MATYSVDPNCYSVKMADGTEYPVKNTQMQIDNPAHIKELSTSDQVKLGFIHVKKTIYDRVPGKYCQQCNFHAHIWSSHCPKCRSRSFTPENN